MLDDVAGIEAAAKELRAAIPELQNAGGAWIVQLGTVADTAIANASTALTNVVNHLFDRLKAAMPKIEIHIETKEG